MTAVTLPPVDLEGKTAIVTGISGIGATVVRDLRALEVRVAELDAAIAQARGAVANDDTEAMILANMAFRDVWLSRVGNERLADAIARFVDHVQTVRLGTLSNPPTRQIVMDGLEGLYEVLVQRDAAKTRVRMAAFLAAAEKAFFSVRQAELAGSLPLRRSRTRT